MSGVYISYPFCAQKCTYCNFASGVLPRELEPRYIAGLRTELRNTRWPWTPDSVYFGGGTPSQMDAAALAAILSEIPRAAGPLPWLEATMEAAPGGITPDLAEAWHTAGINRVSLGVQSFITGELRRTGRKHDFAIVRDEVAILRAAGITNFNIDLIAGLPGQTRASWDESLDRLLELDPPHVSVYMLEVDEDSRLGSEVIAFGQRYGAPDVPNDDAITEFYEIAVERLAAAGIPRYEISNFARPGFESRHNLKYWRREPYLGFGSDAHSFSGDDRWANVETAQDYVERIDQGQSPEAERTAADPIAEPFFLGLRLDEGIGASEVRSSQFAPIVARLIEDGLLVHQNGQHNGRVRLTPRGVLVSNEVFAEFLPEPAPE